MASHAVRKLGMFSQQFLLIRGCGESSGVRTKVPGDTNSSPSTPTAGQRPALPMCETGVSAARVAAVAGMCHLSANAEFAARGPGPSLQSTSAERARGGRGALCSRPLHTAHLQLAEPSAQERPCPGAGSCASSVLKPRLLPVRTAQACLSYEPCTRAQVLRWGKATAS